VSRRTPAGRRRCAAISPNRITCGPGGARSNAVHLKTATIDYAQCCAPAPNAEPSQPGVPDRMATAQARPVRRVAHAQCYSLRSLGQGGSASNARLEHAAAGQSDPGPSATHRDRGRPSVLRVSSEARVRSRLALVQQRSSWSSTARCAGRRPPSHVQAARSRGQHHGRPAVLYSARTTSSHVTRRRELPHLRDFDGRPGPRSPPTMIWQPRPFFTRSETFNVPGVELLASRGRWPRSRCAAWRTTARCTGAATAAADRQHGERATRHRRVTRTPAFKASMSRSRVAHARPS